MSLLLAQSGHRGTLNQCQLLEVKRTLTDRYEMPAFDPKRTLVSQPRGTFQANGYQCAKSPCEKTWGRIHTDKAELFTDALSSQRPHKAAIR
jgi:hypothetical protein